MRSLAAALAFSLVSLTAFAEPVDYTLDMSHSSIGFKVPHLVVSSVSGRFKEVNGAVIKIDDQDLTKSQVSIDIKVDSISTDETKRDEHLKSPDFFDSKKYPSIKFTSKKITKAGKGYKLLGELTIRDKTLPVTLDAQVSAPVKTPWGKQVRAIKLTGKINRTAFGLTYSKALETGGLVVGEEVTLDIEAEILK